MKMKKKKRKFKNIVLKLASEVGVDYFEKWL